MNTHRVIHSVPPLLLAALTAGLVAACGGAKKPPISASNGGASNKNSGVQSAYRYADCMRSHGVTAFGDPSVHTNGNSTSVGFHVDPQMTGSPSWKSAQHACAHILPGLTQRQAQDDTAAHAEALLAFAKCMRQHGFPKFPDPNSQGRLDAAMLSAAGINLQQPAIKPAAYACAPLTHGILTKAIINQAIANPNGGSQSASSGG